MAKIEYWSFLDWLTQPLAEFDTNAGADRAINFYSLTLFLVYTLTDIFKAGLFELLAVFDQYDFAGSLRWINASVLIIALLYFITDTKKLF